jgi:hypothetical protein
MTELVRLPPGLRVVADVAAGLLAFIGLFVGAAVGVLLHWPLNGLEAVLGAALPYVIIAGGTRLIWAAYMLITIGVLWLINVISQG